MAYSNRKQRRRKKKLGGKYLKMQIQSTGINDYEMCYTGALENYVHNNILISLVSSQPLFLKMDNKLGSFCCTTASYD